MLVYIYMLVRQLSTDRLLHIKLESVCFVLTV